VETELKQALGRRRKRYIRDARRIPSAVLIPLFINDEQVHVVFIKRTRTVKTHKGQISFPGGSRERNDPTLLDTALRESEEEIGLRRSEVDVLGELDDEITSTSNYIVTPFVGVIPWPYRFKKNIAEVDEVLEIPVPVLLAPDCRRPFIEVQDGEKVDAFAYHCVGRVIWGATARILDKFLEIYVKSVNRIQSPPDKANR
jgi:8-oxo-dGTP pyrophosphatase MutT (NUDIX family)